MPWIYSQDFHGFSFLHKTFQVSFTRNSSSLLCYQTKLWRILDLSQARLALILAQFPWQKNPQESLANFLHLVKFPVVFLCLRENLLNTFRKSLPTTFWPRKKLSNCKIIFMCSVTFGISKIPAHCLKGALVTWPLSASGLFRVHASLPLEMTFYRSKQSSRWLPSSTARNMDNFSQITVNDFPPWRACEFRGGLY